MVLVGAYRINICISASDFKDEFAFFLEFHYNIFPKAIGQIVHACGVQEFHLSLTRGRWKTQLWGYPPVFTPSGVEAWAWFLPEYGYGILY